MVDTKMNEKESKAEERKAITALSVSINEYLDNMKKSLKEIAYAEILIAESLKELVKIVKGDYDRTEKEYQDRIKKEFPNIN